jgi:hypothetical protein
VADLASFLVSPGGARKIEPLSRSGALLAALGLLGGCSGATPLLHPAHVESQGTVVAGAGLSGELVAGTPATALQAAREATVDGVAVTKAQADTYRKGALVVATMSPGVSPFVGARVGLGYDAEGGVAYSGRAFRVDIRRAFQTPTWALSLGLGGHALLVRRGDDPHASLRGLDLQSTSGYGIDLPIVGGWRSAAGLFSVWGGARVGYDKQTGEIGLGDIGTPGDASLVDWKATRLWGGGVLGMTAGFRHIFVSLEVDALYGSASATAGDQSIAIKGVSIAPAGAIQGRF